MRKLSKLLFGIGLLTLWSWAVSAQTTTVLSDHYRQCNSAVTYDDTALDEGFPAGTWGPGDNPSGTPPRVFISHHGLRLRVPNTLTGRLSVKGIYIWFAPATRVVGSADRFSFKVFRLSGGNLEAVGSKDFRLTDFPNVGRATQPQTAANYLALNLPGINPGDELVFALETKTPSSDDIITFHYSLPTGEGTCATVPSAWHTFINDAATGGLLPGVPPLFNDFFNLKSDKTSEDMAGNPMFLPEIQSDPIQANTVTVCSGECTQLNAAGGAATYEWSPRTGLATPTAQNTQACARRSAQYIRIARNAAGNILRQDTFNVDVRERPIATIVPSGPTQFCEGQQVTLTVQNPNSYGVQWLQDGKPFEGPGATTTTINATTTGLYTVELNNQGCRRTSLATYVYVLPSVRFRITGWPYMCGAGFTDLELKGEYDARQTFNWNPAGPTFPNGEIQISNQGQRARVDLINNPPQQTATFTVSAVSAEGCTASRRVTVRQRPQPNQIAFIYDTFDYENTNPNYTPPAPRATVCNNEQPFIFRVGPQRPFGNLTWTPNLPGLITPVNDPDGENNQFQFDPSKVTSNTTFTLTWAGTYNGCPFTATHTIRVTAVVIPRIITPGDLVCSADVTTVNLSLSIPGEPVTWNLYRITPTGEDLLPPATLGGAGNNRTVSIAAVGIGCYIAEVTGTNQNCPYTVRDTFCIIDQNQVADITGIDNNVCTTDGLKELVANIPGGQFVQAPGNGIDSLTVNGRANFDPKRVDIPAGQDTVNVTITYTGRVGTCNLTGTRTVTVYRSELEITGIPANYEFCTGISPVCGILRPRTITVSGTFAQFTERDGDTICFFPNRAAPGLYTLCFRGITPNGCTIDSCAQVTVTAPPDVVQLINFPNTVCSNRTPIRLTAIPAGGTFTSRFGAGVIRTNPDGTVDYVPGNIQRCDTIDPGTPILDSLVYSGNFGGCPYRLNTPVTVICIPGVRTTLDTAVCLTDGIIRFEILPAGGTLNAPFPYETLPPGNVFEIDTRRIGLGCYNWTYSGRIAICDYSFTQRLCIDPPVDTNFIRIQIGTNPPNPPFVCSTADPIELIGLEPLGGTFDGPGIRQVGTQWFLNPNPNDLPTAEERRGLGTFVYRGKRGGCNYSKQFRVNIDIVGDAIINLPDTVCLAGLYPVVFSPSGGTAEVIDEDAVPQVILDTVTDQNPFIFRPSDYVNVDDTPKRLRIRYFGTTDAGCVYDTSRVITVTDTFSTAALNGLDSVYCRNAGLVTVTVSPTGGVFFIRNPRTGDRTPWSSGPGEVILDIDSIFTLFGVEATLGLELVYEGSSGGCSVFASRRFRINSFPRVVLSTDRSNLCVGNSANLTVLPADQSVYDYQWFKIEPGVARLLSGQTRPALSTEPAPGGGGRYVVRLTNRQTRCSVQETLQINASTDRLEWDSRSTETFAKGPSPTGNGGCNEDGYILATVKERFPGERFEFFVITADGSFGPLSSGLNFIEIYAALYPSIPVTGGKFTIRAVDAAGCEKDTTLIVTSTCCPVPQDVAIANVEPQDRSFVISWLNDDLRQGYEIQIKRQGEDEWLPTPPIFRLGSESSFEFNDGSSPLPLVEGASYCIRVRTVCEAENDTVYAGSEWVERCLVLSQDCPTLFSPIRLTEITTSGVNVGWEKVPGVVGYRIQVDQTDIPNDLPLEFFVGDTNSFDVTFLVPNTNYTVSVSSDCGAGRFSDAVSDFFTTLDACPPPAGIRIEQITSRSARVMWDEVPGALNYEVFYVQIGATDTVNAGIVNGTMIDLEGLECGANYVVLIRNFCGGLLFSSFGNEIFTTLPCCGAPDNVRSVGETATTISLEWDNVPSATSYYIRYSLQGSGVVNETRVFTPRAVLTGLQLTSPYDVEIFTICGADTSAPFSQVFNTNDDCPAPIEVQVGQTSPSTATLSWIAPLGVETFVVTWSIDGVFISEQTVTATSYTITDLNRGTPYEVTVRSQCAPASESNRVPVSFSTDLECGNPSNVLITNVLPTTLNVSWTAGSGAQSYLIRYRNISLGGLWQTRTSGTASIQLSSLQPDSEYEIQVRSVCGPVDVSQWTTSAFVFTPQGVSCGIPTGLTVNNISQISGNAIWAAVPNATSYEIYARPVSSTEFPIRVNSTQNFRLLTGLMPGTCYRVKVRAVCGSVFGDFTAETQFCTPVAKEDVLSSAESALSYTVYPNPTRGDFNVSFTGETETNVVLFITDVTGREVFRKSYGSVTGENTLEVPLQVAPGIYTLFFQAGDRRTTTKLVVE